MRIRAQKASLWIAALSAIAGTILVLTFLYSADKPSYLLDGMEFTAAASILALVLNIVLILVDREQQLQPAQTETDAPGDPPMTERNEAATTIKRRQVLDQRLQIDEPRLCSKNGLCTCWSFCGGESGLDSITVGFRSREIMLEQDVLPAAILTVDRSKVHNCPFS